MLHVTQEYATPLLESQWPNDPHGTVTDYWIEAIRVAAELNTEIKASGEFKEAFTAIIQKTVPPHVVLLLNVNRQTLAERVAYRSHAAQQSDIFSDLSCGTSDDYD